MDVELLDLPAGASTAELSENLADIARLNRLGLLPALARQLRPFLLGHDTRRAFRIVDFGTGGADIPAYLVRWGERTGRRIDVLALDLRPDVLGCVVPAARGVCRIQRVAADALRPPLKENGVDLAICSLTLHHLTEESVVALFRVMATVARMGFIVSDLRRSRAGYLAAWLATRFFRNRLTRHDGPLSVLRAYTSKELQRLAADAGLPAMRWRRMPFFRVVGIYRREPG